MGTEKQGSRGGGGYVGGFFHLFDWNAKSRKKLFSSKSDLPEQPKQKKRSDGNLPMTRFNMINDDDFAGSSIRASSDYSCASSVTDEDGCVSKAPSVVARLMGLNSLPTSNFPDACSNLSFDSQSLRDGHYQRQDFEVTQKHQIAYSGNLHQTGAPFRNVREPKPLKIINRPIEKFQTETLPPKSAKSTPITLHKLLSPIKSPGFVPSANVAQIMEAAAKIIESGCQGGTSTTTVKMPLVGSSSGPLRVKDLKEKVEASRKPFKLAESSRRPTESNAAKYLKGQSMTKIWNGSGDSKSLEDECSTYSKNKGKSISLALQAKVNVQKREGLNSSGGNRSLFSQKEETDAITSQLFISQPNTQRGTNKKPSIHNASGVLRQNNQKQNCLADRGKVPSKSLPSKKLVAGDSSFGRQKSACKSSGNSKVGPRKLSAETTECKREVPYARRKRTIDGDFHLEKDQALENIEKSRKVNQSSALGERQFGWAEESKRNGMDVVSFTFTAPMASSAPSPEASREALNDYRGKRVLLNPVGNSATRFSPLSYNVIGGGDALSTLLEQKLRELTDGVESSRRRVGTAGNSGSIFHDLVPNFKAGNTTGMLHDKRSQYRIHTDELTSQISSGFSSTDPPGLARKYKTQEAEDAYSSIGNGSEGRKNFDHRHPSPISVLEPSFFTESCNSSDTMDSNSTEGCKQSSSVHAQEVLGTSFTELSDSASSTSTAIAAGKQVDSSNWELEYVNKILCNIELMFSDFALGRADKIINPNLFDQLESGSLVLRNQGDESKLRRKVLFDCVSECTDSRCRVWAKGSAVVKRKDWLARDVYKEITGWEAMGECMVDELVDKDMSGQRGRWLDYEVETFELGIEIERRVLNSLINEVVADILQL